MAAKNTRVICTYCDFCDVRFDDSLAFDEHRCTKYHTLQYYLFMYNKKRENIVKNRHGVSIDVSVDPSINQGIVQLFDTKGLTKAFIAPNQMMKFELCVKNDGKETVELFVVDMLMFHAQMVITDRNGVHKDGNGVQIRKGDTYVVKVQFSSEAPSVYIIPVAFVFVRPGKEKTFTIARDFWIEVQRTDEHEEAKKPEEIKESPFQGELWIKCNRTVPCTIVPGKRLRPLEEYKPPRIMRRLVQNRLNPPKNMSADLLDVHKQIMDMHRQIITLFDGELEIDNYKKWFHTLLHIEEWDEVIKMDSYNMTSVYFKKVEDSPMFKLEVPGLSEKRPSILKGDFIYARVRLGEKPTDVEPVQYEGIVHDVRDEFIHVGFSEEFTELYDPDLPFDVRFTTSRYPIVTMHRAVDNLVYREMFYIAFPECFPECGTYPDLLSDEAKESLRFDDERVRSNPEQKTAVVNILLGTSRPAPYLIFGPPGTGKTITVVEAILQVKKVFAESYIIVCSSSNAACDLLTRLLGPKMDKEKQRELLRLHSSTRDWNTVPDDVKPWSNYKDKEYYLPHDIPKYRIVICTLTGAGRLVDKLPQHFTHVFIDECGQALEPEALIPIAGLLGSAENQDIGGHVILAGDPMQLGPVCNSYIGERFEFHMSFLERLMKTCRLYQKGRDGEYDSRFLTKLLRNYRSNPEILRLPNELFYDNELEDCAPPEVKNDPLIAEFPIPKKNKPFPVIFHGVLGWDRREGRSPSYYNDHEKKEVLRYLNILLNPNAKVPLKPSEVGIVTPYIRQVHKLRVHLEKKGWKDVLIGSVEAFQGQEKRVIIISTVRSNPRLLDYDKKFKLGFLVDKKRFNVAVTRAQTLLIVIGNPYNLCRDKRWRRLIEFTQENKSYAGFKYKKKDDKCVEDMLRRMGYLGIEDNNEK